MSNKTKAILFINLYCIFDTLDNINAKVAFTRNVTFYDIAFARIFFNFLSACLTVCIAGRNPFKEVPDQHKFKLGLRSVLLTIG